MELRGWKGRSLAAPPGAQLRAGWEQGRVSFWKVLCCGVGSVGDSLEMQALGTSGVEPPALLRTHAVQSTRSFWNSRTCPGTMMAAFPPPLGADTHWSSVQTANSPSIQASKGSISTSPARVLVLGVSSGQWKKCPVGQCQLSRRRSAQTAPSSCAAPKLTAVDPGEQLVHVCGVVQDAWVGCHFWGRKKMPRGALPPFPCPLSASNPASSAAPQLTLVDPRQELSDVLGDVLWGVCTRCRCWPNKSIPSGAMPAFPQPRGVDSLPPALQPLNSRPDCSEAALQESRAQGASVVRC
ncbi:uncharacterized protein LOC125695654 [Lagopus muta]|uniref:uncharacterized protein LOC125695654 n=1 Tax=Lagopus muta TaxID=64668 RepID=UPI00209E40B0|nr:uncharacterized protein LOC125695654 [Lagopus muta]